MICKYCGRQIPDGTLCSCQQAQQEAMNFNQYQQPQPPFQQMQSPFPGQNMQPPYDGQPQFYQQGQNMQPPYPQQNMARAGMAVSPEAAPYINDFGNNKRVLRKGRVIMCILIAVFAIVLIAGIIGITAVIKKDKDEKAKKDPNYISSEISDSCSDIAEDYINAIENSDGKVILEKSIPDSILKMQNSAEIAEMSIETKNGCDYYKNTIASDLGHIDDISLKTSNVKNVGDTDILADIEMYYTRLGVTVDKVYAVESTLTIKGSAKTDVQKGNMYMVQLDNGEILVYPEKGIGSDYRQYY